MLSWLSRLILAVIAVLLIVLPGVVGKCAPGSTQKVMLAAVGDVLLCRGVGKQINAHGIDYPFEKIQSTISCADITMFNLECPLSNRGIPQRRKYLFRADPAFAGVLRKNGLTVASLANNHTLDYGRDSLLDTINAVENSGIVAVGAGKTKAEAMQVRIINKNGLRIGFMALSDVSSPGVVKLSNKPTVAAADIYDLPAQIRVAKGKCDVLVVSFHWGVEYMKRPTERQVMLAHISIDNGADLVVGHHPHVLQTVETYKNKPIVYSMGGFVWDPILPGTDMTAIYWFELRKSSARLTYSQGVKVVECRPELYVRQPKSKR